MAVIKHVAGKSSSYSAAEEYLTTMHNEKSGKQIKDKEGKPVPRTEYLIQGILCTPDTFAIECQETNLRFHKNQEHNDIKTHHYIISFDPRDRENHGLTMDLAQQLGMQFAQKNFPGHQALVCTHPDGHNSAGNIHVHIVINSVRAVDAPEPDFDHQLSDYKAGFKHHCSKKYLTHLQEQVMKMCRDNGLYQTDLNHADIRQTNKEYRARQEGQRKLDAQSADIIAAGITPKKTVFETEKDRMRAAIDSTRSRACSETEFKQILKEEYHIEVSESRGRWSFLPEGRQRPITSRKLGDIFSKEYILAHLNEEKVITSSKIQQPTEDFPAQINLPTGHKINLAGNIKVQNSSAYAQWAKIHNLKLEAANFNFITENGMFDDNVFRQEYDRMKSNYESICQSYQSVSRQIKDTNRSLLLVGRYLKTKAIYREYTFAKKSAAYLNLHKTDLSIYQSAVSELRQLYPDQPFPALKELKAKKQALLKQRDLLASNYSAARSQMQSMDMIRKDRQEFLATITSNLESSRNIIR